MEARRKVNAVGGGTAILSVLQLPTERRYSRAINSNDCRQLADSPITEGQSKSF
jgi:hypothetical protein